MKTYTLKELRQKNKETQLHIANTIGINRSLYSHYENGKRIPRIDVAKKIANYFNVSVEQIDF